MKKIICILFAIILILSSFAISGVSADSGNTGTTESSQSTSTAPQAEDTKYIALTFDDGPNNNTCAQILDKLETYDVPATFFVIGNMVGAGTKNVLQRMVDLNCQIGYHGYNHSNMGGWSLEEIQADFNKTSDAIFAQVGVRPHVVRWPYLTQPGPSSNGEFPYPCMGGGGPADYDGSSTQSRIDGHLKAAQDGYIALMHCYDNNNNTRDALDTIIPELKNQGYTFVTIDEMFEKQGRVPYTTVQWKIVNRYGEPYDPPIDRYALYEAETAKVQADVTTGTYKQIDMIPNATLLRIIFSAAGQTATFNLPNMLAGKYKILTASRDTSGRGACDYYIGDEKIGAIDFNDTKINYNIHKTGTDGKEMEFEVEQHSDVTLTLKCTKSGTVFIDYFVLISEDNLTQPTTIAPPTTEPISEPPTEPTTKPTAQPTTKPTESAVKPTTDSVFYGDANGDKKINAKDVLIIRKYIAKIPVSIELDNSDANADGKVNAKDVLLIRKYIAKYKVSLGK